MIASEPGEQGDADVHHPLRLRDYDGAPPKPGQPVPLPCIVSLDAVRLILARIELSNWQEHAIDGVIVRAVEPRAPARQPLDQALASGRVTTAAFPVNQLPCRTIPSLPDPERFGLFFQIVPYLVELDHHRPAFWLGLLGVSLGELLEPGLDRGWRDTQELGGAV